jgi:hypothetical protein|tara:strand:- start:46 stop:453 length:408 start_codon:yes stop_codon:yes gene_type:complete
MWWWSRLALVAAAADALRCPSPMMGTVGGGAISELHGNYVLRPPAQPRALIHFLGGAFVGAAPQLTYGRLLHALAAEGYLVVATPFELRFDYLSLCSSVLDTIEPAHEELTAEYGTYAADMPLIVSSPDESSPNE